MRGGGGGGGRKIHRRVDHAMCARLWLDTIRSSSGRYPTVQTRKPEEQRDKHDVTQRKDKIFSIKNRKEGRGEFPVDSVRIYTLHCVSYHLVEERSIDLQLKSVCKKKKSGSMRFLLCAMSNC